MPTIRIKFLNLLLIVGLIAIPIIIQTRSTAAISGIQLSYSFSTVINSGEMLGTVAIGDIDNDPALEIVVNSRQGIHIYDYDGSLISTFNTNNGSRDRLVNTAPTLSDIDGDGRQEVIFATGHEAFEDYINTNSIFAVNGEDGSLVWEMPITRANYTSPDSGYQTIQGKFYYDGAVHDQLPMQTSFTANASAIPVYDIDGDGQREVIITLKIRPEPTQDYNPYINDIWGFGEFGTVGESWSGGNLILNAATGSREYIYHFLQLCEAGIALGQVDKSWGTAIFTLTDSDSIVGYHKTQSHGFYGASSLIGQFGKNARLQSGSYKKPVSLNAVDLTGDGKVEVLYEGHNLADLLWQGSSAILDHQGQIIWREWYDFPETSDLANIWPNASQMIPLNLDGGDPEIISWHHTNQLFYESWDGVQLISKGSHWPVSFGDQFPSPPVIGDIDGDGAEEIVVARYNPVNPTAPGGLTVLAQNGNVKEDISTNYGIKNIPNLYDIDQDGDLDIIARDIAGTIYVYDTGSGDPKHITWATEYRSSDRIGALGMQLYASMAPVVSEIIEGNQYVELNWAIDNPSEVDGFAIYRKKYTDPDFSLIALPAASARQFVDQELANGELYIYKLATVYAGESFYSAPIPAVPLTENNLVNNSGMELNGDHSWDKWYTGDIAWQDMIQSTSQAYQGNSSMQIHLQKESDNSSIKQWNQYGIIEAQHQVTAGELYSFGGFVKTNLDQSSQQFFEWGSDYDKYRHDPVGDPIPGRDWPFYFSTHIHTPGGESRWWYTNRTFVLQDGITGLALRHRFDIDSEASATGNIYLDDVFFREVGTESAEAITLLPFESSWRYFDSDPPTNWYATHFDDRGWLLGQAKFGVGSGPDNINTSLSPYRDQFYFRTTFDLDEDLSEWVAYAYSTSGPGNGPGIKDIYINGQYVPIQDPGLTLNPGNEIRHLDLSPFIDRLVPGINVVAVRLENEYQLNNWDDVAYDMQFKGVVLEASRLLAAKTAQPVLPGNGDLVTYTIEIHNPSEALPGILVTDTLPTELAYQGNLWASSGTYYEDGGVIYWNGPLDAGGAVKIIFSTRVDPGINVAMLLTNSALVDDQQGNISVSQATIFVNGYAIYLPITIR